MAVFSFKNYYYDPVDKKASFIYQNGPDLTFTEVVTFNEAVSDYDEEVLDRSLFLAFMLVGTSYYKTFHSSTVKLEVGGLDDWQVNFFNSVYQEGLSQFAFENGLERKDLAHFEISGSKSKAKLKYQPVDTSPLVLQSGGKDSLLLACLLLKKRVSYTPWFLQNSQHHPAVLDTLSQRLVVANRAVDLRQLEKAIELGGQNGHVPVTYIVLSLALVQAVLLSKDTVISAIGHEGEEPHTTIGDLSVMHQWSKTWQAEQQFAQYVQTYIAKNIKVGSALRQYSELKIAELFVETAWDKYAREFSSCNIANYLQGMNNERLQWCGDCPKCANSFLLFAPFVEPDELIDTFNGQNLFLKPSLSNDFKGLLGLEGAMKPFECVGEIDELRQAYHMARQKYGSNVYVLPFDVPPSNYDYNQTYSHQGWAAQ